MHSFLVKGGQWRGNVYILQNRTGVFCFFLWGYGRCCQRYTKAAFTTICLLKKKLVADHPGRYRRLFSLSLAGNMGLYFGRSLGKGRAGALLCDEAGHLLIMDEI